jgi:protein gp37
MSKNTKIEWATHTFNPWEGCQKVGPGCDNCYAENRNARFAGGTAINWGPGAPRRRTSVQNWKKPLAWNDAHEAFFAANGHRQRVFCASLADVFDNAVDPAWRYDLFNLILSTPNLDWLLLTKRIGNAAKMIADTLPASMKALPPDCPVAWPWPNVWIGATIVNQEEADRDIPKLLAVPAAKRFLSMEPLLGPVDLSHLNKDCETNEINALKPDAWEDEIAAWRDTDDEWEDQFEDWYGVAPKDATGAMHSGVDWVIVGGESGPNARPMHPQWALDLRDQCAAAGVPHLFKQWGEWQPISQMGDTNSLYRSRIKARPHEDQGALDDSYGRKCIVANGIAHHDGSLHEITAPMACLQGTGAMQTFRVGKKAAGRQLDGITHDGVPAEAAL